MKTSSLFPLFLLLVLFVTSCKQSPQENKSGHSEKIISQTEKILHSEKTVVQQSLHDFIPQNYFLLDSALGSLDNENTQHIALVCAPKFEQNRDTFSEVNRRMILLQRKNNSLTQIASNDELILCKSCGGVFGDPYNGISLQNNILTISNYGGSAWRWSENYTFRFQNNKWQLIGANFPSYWVNAPCKENQDVTSGAGHLEDINFSTNKMHIINTKTESCEPFEDYWKSFGKKKPISLDDFPGAASQWPSGKIKDGDGKE